MRYIIAGSRDMSIGFQGLKNALEFLRIHINPDYDTILSGGCPTGPDAAAKIYATQYSIDYVEYPADWDRHGSSAGPRRNRVMASNADALILIWDGESRGSLSMLTEAKAKGIKVHQLIIPKGNS